MTNRRRSSFSVANARKWLEDSGDPEPLMPALIEGGRVFMQGVFGVCALMIARHFRTEATQAFESGPFVLLLVAIGLGFLLPVVPQVIGLLRLAAFRLLHVGQADRFPDTPWEWDQPWDKKGTHSLILGRAGDLSGVLAFLMAALAPLHLMAFSGGETPGLFLAVIALLDAGILLGWGFVIYRVLMSLKFGLSRLAFPRFPFFLGEPLDVTLLDVDRLREAPEIHITLRCREQYLEEMDSGKSALKFRSVWKETRRFSPEDLPFGQGEAAQLAALSRRTDDSSRFNIRFELPDSAIPNRLTDPGNLRFWELLVTARMKGIDYKASFALPVYKRPPGKL